MQKLSAVLRIESRPDLESKETIAPRLQNYDFFSSAY